MTQIAETIILRAIRVNELLEFIIVSSNWFHPLRIGRRRKRYNSSFDLQVPTAGEKVTEFFTFDDNVGGFCFFERNLSPFEAWVALLS